MPINARNKGHTFERKFVEYLKIYGYEAVTSRSESKRMDDKGVDIIDNTPFYFQCKAVERSINNHDIINRMPTEKMPVVVHKKNNKGTLVTMKLEHFANLLLFRHDD